MNKTTFSHYGTIIAVVIILAIMVAFATPFGDYISNSTGQTIDSFSTKSNTQLSEANGRNFRFAKLKGLNQTLIVSAANQSSQSLQYDAVEVVDPALESGLVAFTSGSVDELNVQNAVIYDIEVSGEYSSATLDLNVSEFANTGETVAVYHYNEGASEWEHIGNYTVSASGIITASFTSFSPVAIVNISRDYTTNNATGSSPKVDYIVVDSEINIVNDFESKNYMITSGGHLVLDQSYVGNLIVEEGGACEVINSEIYGRIENKGALMLANSVTHNDISNSSSGTLQCNNVNMLLCDENHLYYFTLSDTSCASLQNVQIINSDASEHENINNIILSDHAILSLGGSGTTLIHCLEHVYSTSTTPTNLQNPSQVIIISAGTFTENPACYGNVIGIPAGYQVITLPQGNTVLYRVVLLNLEEK